MRIDTLALQMRPRAAHEAADLGVRLCQETARSVYACYPLVAVPTGLVAMSLFEIAPWLIVVFKQMKDELLQNESDQVYYVNESVGIACGLLLAAIHHAGLVALTHTPSPMKFLAEILRRPDYERPFLLIPVGHPADDCVVPDIQRKSLEQIMVVDR